MRKLKIVKEFILREIAGEYVLVPTGKTTEEFQGLITLSDTAKFIWEHLEQAQSFQELVDMLEEEYDADADCVSQDAHCFINRMIAAGFVECSRDDRSW